MLRETLHNVIESEDALHLRWWVTRARRPRLAPFRVLRCGAASSPTRSWNTGRSANTMDVALCLGALGMALKSGVVPEIFNTDQGSRFT